MKKPEFSKLPLSYVELYPLKQSDTVAEAACAFALALCALFLTIILFAI
jgi:hypothetical protein